MKNEDFTMDERAILKHALENWESELSLDIKNPKFKNSAAYGTLCDRLQKVSRLIDKVKIFV